ncbi:hypothetical protein [Glycomyces buryatensis]|uniref:Uncharacterized protein n=1 Tax=Glycomyces buryatensis TaxID=2570927 RepID=A0A4V4HS79_9ACTN|nr:hypothetical protein [Glycomyces buryatensis]THV40496.1 hypothetical protein FAB82_14585 [Glycomyces buryatensis]
MNDFELHYLHHSRSTDLIAEAEGERQARRLIKDAKRTRSAAAHRGEKATTSGHSASGGEAKESRTLAARVAKALHRSAGQKGSGAATGGAGQFQPAK